MAVTEAALAIVVLQSHILQTGAQLIRNSRYPLTGSQNRFQFRLPEHLHKLELTRPTRIIPQLKNISLPVQHKRSWHVSFNLGFFHDKVDKLILVVRFSENPLPIERCLAFRVKPHKFEFSIMD